MNIKTFVISSTILLVIVYLLVWQIKPFEYAETSEFIPDNTLLYIEQKNVEGFLNDVENSKIGKAVQSIDFLTIGKEIKVEDEKLELLQKINDAIKANWDNKIVREFLGEKIALALLKPLRAHVYPSLIDFFKTSAVLITQPKHKAEFLQVIAEQYATYSKDVSISTHQYGVHHIKRISIDGEILSTVVIDGLYLISFEEQQLRRCIDTFDNESPSLPEDTEYSSLRDHYPAPDQFLYLSLKGIRELVSQGLLTYEFAGRDIVNRELAATIGFRGFSYGAWKTQSLVKERFMVMHNDKIANNFVAKQLKVSPSICDTMRFSPQNPLIFYWTNTIDFESMYNYYIEKFPEPDNQLTTLSKTFEEQTGENIGQFFSLLGKEFSSIVTSNQKSTFLPVPYGVMLFKIENREKLEKMLEKLISSYDFPLIKDVYGSTSFYYWENSPQDGLEPLYGFLENYLFVGNSRRLAKQVIDSSGDGINLLQDSQFVEIGTELTEPNNYISYTNNAELINILKSVLTLAGNLVAIEDKEAARKISIITKDIVNPLLDGLSMFEKTSTRGYFTENSVVIDSMTKIVE